MDSVIKEFPRAALFCFFVSNSVLILLMKCILNEAAPLIIVLFKDIQRRKALLTVMASHSFYNTAFQDLHKLLEITLTECNPNVK